MANTVKYIHRLNKNFNISNNQNSDIIIWKNGPNITGFGIHIKLDMFRPSWSHSYLPGMLHPLDGILDCRVRFSLVGIQISDYNFGDPFNIYV